MNSNASSLQEALSSAVDSIISIAAIVTTITAGENTTTTLVTTASTSSTTNTTSTNCNNQTRVSSGANEEAGPSLSSPSRKRKPSSRSGSNLPSGSGNQISLGIPNEIIELTDDEDLENTMSETAEILERGELETGCFLSRHHQLVNGPNSPVPGTSDGGFGSLGKSNHQNISIASTSNPNNTILNNVSNFRDVISSTPCPEKMESSKDKAFKVTSEIKKVLAGSISLEMATVAQRDRVIRELLSDDMADILGTYSDKYHEEEQLLTESLDALEELRAFISRKIQEIDTVLQEHRNVWGNFRHSLRAAFEVFSSKSFFLILCNFYFQWNLYFKMKFNCFIVSDTSPIAPRGSDDNDVNPDEEATVLLEISRDFSVRFI